MPVAYLLPDSAIGPDTTEFFEAFEQFEERLHADGLSFADPFSEGSEVQIVQVWPLAGQDGEVRIYDNYMVGVRHLELQADDPSLLDRLVGHATALLPLDDPEALAQAWNSGDRDDPRLLARVGLGASAPLSDAALSAISRAIHDPDAAVRCMAAYAAILNGDPRFAGHLRQQLDQETDANAADIMTRGLDLFDES